MSRDGILNNETQRIDKKAGFHGRKWRIFSEIGVSYIIMNVLNGRVTWGEVGMFRVVFSFCSVFSSILMIADQNQRQMKAKDLTFA